MINERNQMQKILCIIIFYFKMSRINARIEIEFRVVVSRDWEEWRMGSD
jgi:hypothetical protein